MKPADRYRQVWPDTVATQSNKPRALVAALIVAQLLATVGTVYLLTVFAFSL